MLLTPKGPKVVFIDKLLTKGPLFRLSDSKDLFIYLRSNEFK